MKLKMFVTKAGAIASAFFIGAAPLTAHAQSNEKECSCEILCHENEVDVDCPVCSYKEGYKECKGHEKWGPLTPDGNMDLVDDYGTLEAGGKQFITVVTKSGNYFYIIIDRDDEGEETVHFLNMVDERDLLSLMDEEEVEAYEEAKALEEEEKTKELVEDEEIETEKEDKSDKTGEIETLKKTDINLNIIMAAVLIATVLGIAVFIFIREKLKKKKKYDGPDPDIGYEDMDEADYLDKITGGDK